MTLVRISSNHWVDPETVVALRPGIWSTKENPTTVVVIATVGSGDFSQFAVNGAPDEIAVLLDPSRRFDIRKLDTPASGS